MDKFEDIELEALAHLKKNWALVSAGHLERFNTCTVSWGSFGVLWGKNAATIYIHPSRYTLEFMKQEEFFTISFFAPTYQKALGVLGTLSGRDGDKIAPSGLTPVAYRDGVTYKEASFTLLCRKVYQGAFQKENIAPEVLEYYQGHPGTYPPNEAGEVQPHYEFVGEIIDVLRKEEN